MHAVNPQTPLAAPANSGAPRLLQSDPLAAGLLDLWKIVSRRKWAILALALTLAVVAGAITLAMTPLYRATASLLIESSTAKVLSVEEVYSGVSQSREYFQTQAEILKSRDVALRVVRQLKLYDNAEFDPRQAPEGTLATLQGWVGLRPPAVTWTEPLLEEAAAKVLTENLDVEPVRLSQIIRISYTSESAELSAEVANAVAAAYIASNRDARFKITQEATDYLQDKLEGLRRNVSAAEAALQQYRERNNIVKVGGASDAIAQQGINNLSQQLTAAQVRRSETETAYQQIKAAKGNYSSIPAVARHPQVLEALNRQSQVELKVSQLSQRYGYEHPLMVAANAELEVAKANTQRQMASVASSLERDYESAAATVRALESRLAAERATVAAVNRAAPQMDTLERNVQSTRQLYDTFLQRARETNLSENMQQTIARVIDVAVAPITPFKPKKAQIVAITLVLGLFLGALIALLLDKLDNTLKGTNDAESRLGLPALTALPLLGNADRKSIMNMVTTKSDSLYAEAVRTARASLMLSNVDLPRKIFLVTSAIAGEGKSSMAANLALAHAQTQPTLLVDADMRRPQVARSFGLAPGAQGLSQLVAGSCDMSQAIHRVDDTQLDVLPCGVIPPNPTELLLSQRFSDTLQKLSEKYGVIIIDSPPVELVSDSMVLSALVTNTLFVVRAQSTPYQIARRGITKIQRAGGRILGTVLTGVDFKGAHKYYGEYSGYGHYGSKDTGYYTAGKA
ncbi:GumC family protein [Amphibiibacter pelophylacis]|uniref:Polysaccharide biosynthesis tyrosine autokinase n=1 Tax=Amphibiibacter pelophylacis TaxID=1799477 RepID=A0ACC6NZ62_9BURK